MRLPSVDSILNDTVVAKLASHYGRRPVVAAVRQALDDARSAGALDESSLPDLLSRRLAARQAVGLKPVFNLTGTVLHTNLGRAPLADEAIAAMTAAAGASSVEFDLATGRRGERDAHVERWLCELTGAEAALVVNNNAAAVLLTLNACIVSGWPSLSASLRGRPRCTDRAGRATATVHLPSISGIRRLARGWSGCVGGCGVIDTVAVTLTDFLGFG